MTCEAWLGGSYPRVGVGGGAWGGWKEATEWGVVTEPGGVSGSILL